MAGIKALRKIQLGIESTSGDKAAATTILRFTGTMADLRETVMPDEDVGLIPGTERVYTPKVLGELQMEGPATFEQLPYVLSCGVSSGLTGVADTGGGTGYLYTFNFGTTTQKTITTLTLEAGDNTQCEYMTYCFVPEFSLSGAGGEAWQLTATWRGRQVDDTSYTAGLSLITVEEILFSKTKIWIDDANSTSNALGTTLKSNTLLAADLKFNTGMIEVFTADGQKYFSFVKSVAPEIVFDLTFEHDATATGLKTDWRAGTSQQMRLKATGSAFGTAGALGTKYLQIDAAGVIETIDKLGEQDGNDIVRVTFRPRYVSTANAGAGLFCNIYVANALAAAT